MSLRSGAPTFGTPEPALAYLAIGQLARRLGVPLRCGGTCARPRSRRPGRCRERQLAVAGVPRRRELHAARGRLARVRARHVVREIRDGRGPAGRPSTPSPTACRSTRTASRWPPSARSGPGKHYLGSQHTLANYENAYLRLRARRQQLLRAVERGGSRRTSCSGPTPAGRRSCTELRAAGDRCGRRPGGARVRRASQGDDAGRVCLRGRKRNGLPSGAPARPSARPASGRPGPRGSPGAGRSWRRSHRASAPRSGSRPGRMTVWGFLKTPFTRYS